MDWIHWIQNMKKLESRLRGSTGSRERRHRLKRGTVNCVGSKELEVSGRVKVRVAGVCVVIVGSNQRDKNATHVGVHMGGGVSIVKV
jgi:hypothetical protein